MRVSKVLLVKAAYLILTGVFSASGISNADAVTFDGVSKNVELSNAKTDGVQYAGCIFDSIIGADKYKKKESELY